MPPKKLEYSFSIEEIKTKDILLNKLRCRSHEMTSNDCEKLQKILRKFTKQSIQQNDTEKTIACFAVSLMLAFISSKFI